MGPRFKRICDLEKNTVCEIRQSVVLNLGIQVTKVPPLTHKVKKTSASRNRVSGEPFVLRKPVMRDGNIAQYSNTPRYALNFAQKT